MQEFLDRHNIKVLNSDNKCESTILKSSLFVNKHDCDDTDDSVINISETLYTVQIPEHVLKWLSNLEHAVFEHPISKNINKDNIFLLNKLIEKNNKEKELRSKIPSLNKAYQEYSMILHLSGENNV